MKKKTIRQEGYWFPLSRIGGITKYHMDNGVNHVIVKCFNGFGLSLLKKDNMYEGIVIKSTEVNFTDYKPFAINRIFNIKDNEEVVDLVKDIGSMGEGVEDKDEQDFYDKVGKILIMFIRGVKLKKKREIKY